MKEDTLAIISTVLIFFIGFTLGFATSTLIRGGLFTW